MLFLSDETLLTVVEWALVWVCGAIMIALPLAVAAGRFLLSDVWSPSALLQELTGERPGLGALLPARCPIRSASDSDRLGPPGQVRHCAGTGRCGWQSDGR
ncbi:MAG: hypothetical protein ACKV2Q_07175 [Planctomycetaceae bacterium]